MTDKPDESPFASIPSGVDIARIFAEEYARDFDGQGADGIPLWRDNREYCYLWMEAHIDHDLQQYFLLEVRTNVGNIETRDYLYVTVGIGCKVECEWHNQPIQFSAPMDDHMDRLNAGLHWFISRVVGDTEEQAVQGR